MVLSLPPHIPCTAGQCQAALCYKSGPSNMEEEKTFLLIENIGTREEQGLSDYTDHTINKYHQYQKFVCRFGQNSKKKEVFLCHGINLVFLLMNQHSLPLDACYLLYFQGTCLQLLLNSQKLLRIICDKEATLHPFRVQV